MDIIPLEKDPNGLRLEIWRKLPELKVNRISPDIGSGKRNIGVDMRSVGGQGYGGEQYDGVCPSRRVKPRMALDL
jgi:hypothetical protein